MSNRHVLSKSVQCFATALLLSATLFFEAVATTTALPNRVPIPVLARMIVTEAHLPIRLQKVDVQAEVLGTAAHTRIEMVFYNPNGRILEGELQFPLLDGQTVTGFALDINGELRPAVPVDKTRGQQVFEDVSRARIDPALLEKTQGNNYKLRVYPLPAQGTRRVVLELDEALSSNSLAGVDNTTYRLPLQFAETVEQLNVLVHNAATPSQQSAMAVRARLGAQAIAVAAYAPEKDSRSGSLLSFSRKNFKANGILSIDYPPVGASLIVTETRADQTYFYAEVAPPLGKLAPRTAPKKLGLVWDASGSGAVRDHGREMAVLDAYFKVLQNVSVELVIARDRAEAPQTFAIKNGDWHALSTALESVVYDGATNVAALLPPGATDLTLLFSDGLGNYGAGVLAAGDAPLFAVNSAASADLPRLRTAAESTGGRLLNLLSTTAANAVHELTHQYPRLLGLRSNGAKELVSASVYPEGKWLKIAGLLTEPQTTIELDWLNSQGRHESQKVTVRSTAKPVASLAANRWATLKIAQLEADYDLNRTAIRRLGNRFGMVTRETSLIVLDRVDDYVRYEIAPPESLRADYESKLALKVQNLRDERDKHLNDIATRFAQKIAWWEKTFPKEDKKTEPPRGDTGAVVNAAPTVAPPPAMAAAPPPAPAPAGRRTAPASRDGSVGGIPATASIQLKKWESDAPYAKRLRQSTPVQMYRVYLDERAAYSNSTAFFLDAADIFIARGQPELGFRILSNLAEMNLENRHILRILAYRLLQAKQTKLALPILQQVLALSPNEPQSWRDLGLAYADDAQYQLAIDNLWEVVSRPWHERFPDIELIALAELNAIVARAPQETQIDTRRIDARLLRNLPLDVRAVLSWDADNTDIDLWITDPNNEKVFYGNRLSFQGGAMTRDFTGGYGPEEFSLRTAKPGKYKVQAHFYGNRQQVVSGATTLMLRLSTGFGTPQQEDENIILRLTGKGAEVEVGTFEVARPE